MATSDILQYEGQVRENMQGLRLFYACGGSPALPQASQMQEKHSLETNDEYREFLQRQFSARAFILIAALGYM